ncbi:mortality factor 4-like protein 1 [Trichosurus vulpecula]|uniref:mortality factor 4-like protein 1 n=1 Tax=Trichosurus vulpecula TaxID=9337 RepID=UPI00186B349D|nr:mortality factor 4-like protein 1 [Trichosurus vulpecula]
MSLSKFQRRIVLDFAEGEPVLIFHGLRMLQGRCIRLTMENTEVKYLVRYPSGTGVGQEVNAQPQQASPSSGGASAQEPENVARCPKAKGSTSRAGPSTSKAGPKTSKAGLSSHKAGSGSSRAGQSTSRTGPSPTRSSTNRAGTSTSPGGQSTSRTNTSTNDLGGAMVQGASSGRSGSSDSVSQGAGGASTSDPQFPASQEASSGWDYEWIPNNRVLRYSPNQLKHDSDAAIQMSARTEQRQAAFSSPRRAFICSVSNKGDHSDPGEGSSSETTQPPAKRPRSQGRPWELSSRSDAGDPQKDSTGGFEVQVNLPKCLRSLLVQDWELVILEKKLCDLPAKVSVDAILSEYAIFPMNCRTRDKKYAVCGLVDVLKEYFNAILSTQLLYDFERPQYDELVVSYPSSQMCELYGGVHLLRLFQQLGPMLSCTSLDDSSLMVLLSHLEDFLEYLASDPYLLFIDAKDYVLASEEHLKVV